MTKKKNLGSKNFISALTSRSLSFIESRQGNNSNRIGGRDRGEALLTGLPVLQLTLNLLSYTAQIHLPGDELPPWDQLSISISSQVKPRHAHKPIWLRQTLSQGSLFGDNSSLWRSEQKLNSTLPLRLHFLYWKKMFWSHQKSNNYIKLLNIKRTIIYQLL